MYKAEHVRKLCTTEKENEILSCLKQLTQKYGIPFKCRVCYANTEIQSKNKNRQKINRIRLILKIYLDAIDPRLEITVNHT